MNDEQIKAAIHASVAKTILDGLDTEARDAFLQKSIADAIRDYSFRRSVEQVVADKATRVVAELVESEEWTQAITTAIREGFAGYLVNLKDAVEKISKEMVHGTSGTYQHAGQILKCWPNE